MLTNWTWALCASYFAFGLYTLWIHKKVIYLFAKHFPDESRRYFANESFNEKRIAGFQFLWDKSVNDLVCANNEINRLRHRARMCFVAFILLVFMFPILLLAMLLINKHLFH
jgi:hypothetical protein